MRTKTLLLSALLGALGSVSVHAQSVYSLNAVGYINVTLEPGFNMITCPLITGPDNTVGTILNNATGVLTGNDVYFYNPSTGLYSEDSARPVGAGKGSTTNVNGWAEGGTNVGIPGVGFWFQNNQTTNIVVTFFGTVPTGPITNVLGAGFNLVGSVVPVSGDIVSNTISAFTNYNIGDDVFTYDSVAGYSTYEIVSEGKFGRGYHDNWLPGDATIAFDYSGFWYDNNVGITVNWVENYSVSQ